MSREEYPTPIRGNPVTGTDNIRVFRNPSGGIDAKTTISVGLLITVIGGLVGAVFWAGVMNTKMDLILQKTTDLEMRLRSVEMKVHP